MAEVFTCESDGFVMRGENDDALAPRAACSALVESCVSSR
jgi:hypothetical protein